MVIIRSGIIRMYVHMYVYTLKIGDNPTELRKNKIKRERERKEKRR